jgi:mevalonate kinase
MRVKAPAVAKLFGEHAVVYGKLSVAVALASYASADIEPNDSSKLEVMLPQLGQELTIGFNDLKNIFYNYAFRHSINEFVEQSKGINEHLLPYAVIASRLMFNYGVNVLGKRVEISSEIPIKKGFASSAACSTSFTVAMLKHEAAKLPIGEIAEIARDGDRVLHKNDGAGAIDVNTTLYGGYVSYSSINGAMKEPISTSMELLFIDTGPKKSTAETVGHVSELHRSQKEYAESLFDMIEECSMQGLEALKGNDIVTVGKLMYRNHELLDKLGVSSNGLNEAVSIAKAYNAYGAKLSGGGGGGMAIAVASNAGALVEELEKKGYSTSTYKVALDGAKSYLEAILNSPYSR